MLFLLIVNTHLLWATGQQPEKNDLILSYVLFTITHGCITTSLT